MIVETVTRTVLRASEGHKLTNGIAYCASVVLSVGDNPEDWYEITIEEYNEILREQEGEYDENIY